VFSLHGRSGDTISHTLSDGFVLNSEKFNEIRRFSISSEKLTAVFNRATKNGVVDSE